MNIELDPLEIEMIKSILASYNARNEIDEIYVLQLLKKLCNLSETNTGEHIMTTPIPELTTFTSMMQNEFDAQYPEKGDSYKDLTSEELFNLLTQKWHLIADTDFTPTSSPSIIKNCVHIANFCMMIAHNLEEE